MDPNQTCHSPLKSYDYKANFMKTQCLPAALFNGEVLPICWNTTALNIRQRQRYRKDKDIATTLLYSERAQTVVDIL